MALQLPDNASVVLRFARTASEIILVGVLAVMAARLVWTVLAPESVGATSRSLPAAQALVGSSQSPALAVGLDILSTANPFQRSKAAVAEIEDAPDAPETSLNLVLIGFRALTEDGGGGSATIILPDGQQAPSRTTPSRNSSPI
ncbi:MAG: type II secretion system protein N [Pseudomonadota bacterium]